jgi:hypothetical protein
MENKTASADCGYSMAVPALLGAGRRMCQKASSATRPSADPDRRPRTRKRPRSASPQAEDGGSDRSQRAKTEDEDDDDDDDDDSSSSSSCCGFFGTRRKRFKDADGGVSTVGARIIGSDAQWERVQTAERLSPFRTVPNYPDVQTFLPPGARRKAVNIIFLMARALNLELCTPGFGVLIMDRFLSFRGQQPFTHESVMLTAMICLNAAGKAVDVDRGYCGSRGVMALLRDATPPSARQKDHTLFALHAAAIEREVLLTLDSNIMSCPCAMQVIAEMTDWHSDDEMSWLKSALVCDIFSADSVSTQYTQTQIARGAVGLVCGSRDIHAATEAMARSISMFMSSAGRIITPQAQWADPYFGIRVRHCDNPGVRALRGMLDTFLLR